MTVMTNPDNRLDGNLVLLAIEHGMCDGDLEAIRKASYDRLQRLATQKAYDLKSGDTFYIIQGSPSYINGEHVRFKSFDGNWLVCEWIGYPPGKYRSREIRLRHTHVGRVIKADGTVIS